MTHTFLKQNQTSIRDQIVQLVDRMPEDMCRKLLQFLEVRLPRHIKKDMVLDKRDDSRKQCLISVDYIIDGGQHTGFILDISAFGVFIESDLLFPIGDTIQISFSLPRYYGVFKLSGQIVWSGTRGFGVKFPMLNRRQREFINSISEEKTLVYKILRYSVDTHLATAGSCTATGLEPKGQHSVRG